MRTLLFITVLIFCTAFRSFAQEPVPLEVWRVNKSNQFRGVFNTFCYLPNFRNGEGKNAIVIRKRSWDDKVDRMETWYNRDEADTLNQFTWPFGFCPYATPDINGDGQRDFFNGSKLYLGTGRDEPDTNTAYQIKGNNYIGYAKLNNDNCDDIYFYGNTDVSEKSMAHFVFGNTTLKKFQTSTVISPHAIATTDMTVLEWPKAIYKNKQGKWRLLTHCKGWVKGTYTTIWQPKKTILRLYSLEFNKISEDSTAIVATQIDEYKDPKWSEIEDDIHTKTPLNWLPVNDVGLLYNSEHFPKILYYASFNTLPDKETKEYNSYATIIDLTDDRIKPTNNNITQIATGCTVLKHSIDGDSIEDLAAQLGDWEIRFYRVLSDGQIKQISVLKTSGIMKEGLLSRIQSIDDISGDGIPDISCLLINNSIGNAFIIAKGKDILSTISENTQINFSIETPYPLPNNSQLIIPLFTENIGSYSLFLYNIEGIKYSLFEQRDLPIGRTEFLVSCSDYSNGTYILRLTDGKQTVEKTILIQH